MPAPIDPFSARAKLTTAAGAVEIFRLDALTKKGVADVSKLPYSLRVLLESALRNCDGYVVTQESVSQLAKWNAAAPAAVEVPFLPARVVLQDFTGVPCVVDLAAMRAHLKRTGGDPKKINPQVPVDLVIDHSVQVDAFGSAAALQTNSDIEFSRNRERYEFLNWGRKALANFRVVPPATGIVHQVNLEYLASVAISRNGVAFPDSVVGTDSHTTMINGLGVVGWGVGGIEAEAVMLNQPIYMLLPQVVGFKLTGRLPEGATATDLVLTVTQMLRKKGVVDKFVEFFGSGLSNLSLADRATIANMAPEYGATVGFFPVDAETLRYLAQTGRAKDVIDLVDRYYKEQGLFRTDESPEPKFTDTLSLDLAAVEPSLAGPKRPQDRVRMADMKPAFRKALTAPIKENGFALAESALAKKVAVKDAQHGGELGHGSVVIAAITSCTNTSNPSVMIAAGLLAKKAVERGLTSKPWVKTSLAPGSRVVTDYLDKAGLTPFLDKLKFHTVGYGCTTCIGNSGPLPPPIAEALSKNTDVVACSVLSGNRNFEGRVHPQVKANYLAGPPMVVAYALAGTVDIDLTKDPLGVGSDGKPVMLKDLWPTQAEVNDVMSKAVTPEAFRARYAGVFESNPRWNAVAGAASDTYSFNPKSTYVREPPYFAGMAEKPGKIGAIAGARVLVSVGDSVTTDHISPAGDIEEKGPAGKYLVANGVTKADFNSYGARRGNHEAMVRGTYANVRVRNLLAPGTEGGLTTFPPGSDVMSIYDASEKYAASKTPLVVLAGKDYGMGSSRDWAAKGVLLLGVKAVIAESYERIHRSNLVGMGVLPLQYLPGQTRENLGLTGKEIFDIGTGAPAGRGVGAGISGRSPTTIARPAAPATFADPPEGVEMSGVFSIAKIEEIGKLAAEAANAPSVGKPPPPKPPPTTPAAGNTGGVQFSGDEFSMDAVKAQGSDHDPETASTASLPAVNDGVINDTLRPKQEIVVVARDPANPNAAPKVFRTICRIDTPVEVDYYRNGGILPTVLRKLGKG